MEITWLGHSCFRLRDRSVAIITDPYDKEIGLNLPRMRADVVTISHDASDHNYVRGVVKGDFKVLTMPGEYEVAGVFITGLELRGERRRKAQQRPPNTVFLFEFEDLTICHLGDLDYVPGQAEVEEALDAVDVLLIPVGGGESLNAAQAAEVVSLLEPRVVIPMHYKVKGLTMRLDPLDKFLREMGLENIAPQETLKVSRNGLPEETQVVLLNIKSKEE